MTVFYNFNNPERDCISPPETPEQLAELANMTREEILAYTPEREVGIGQQQATPVVQNMNSATRNQPELPRSLRSDGLINQYLEKSREQTNDPDRFVTVKTDFNNLCTQFSRQTGSMAGRYGADFESAVTNLGASSDAVLRLVIASQESFEQIKESLLASAVTTYAQNPSFYRKVFGDLLPQSFRDKAEEYAFSNGTNVTVADDLDIFFKRLESKRQQAVTTGFLGLPSGVASLDDALGGLRGLTVIGGNKGVGKTSLVLSAVDEVLQTRPDTNVLFYSLDISKDGLLERMLCRKAAIDYRSLTGAKPLLEEDMERLEKAKSWMKERTRRLRIIERSQDYTEINYAGDESVIKGLSYHQLFSDVAKSTRTNPAKQIMIVIDMIQKWIVPGNQAAEMDHDVYRLNVIEKVRQEFRKQTGYDGIAIVATCEIRKDPGKDLTIDDLKGDGRIGSDADTVLLMSPSKKVDALSDDPVPVNLRIAKTRDGGRRGVIPLMFDHVHYRFHESQADPKPKRSNRRTVSNNSVNPLAQ